ncbi:hypothetical protein BD324DRAFT_633144 [Kockovaella imperatae]|uniref:Ion transport domain-containing protein n=1 Tax=Kockovaella imperatae TaxID=4999 RepID=A0A1Y1UA61_9TREE|nr:hypothetical protein BD324DRAFT_633144 [Kockovaella imperatae]ORX34909.1 hypothetical protein BD324DRAFT_633144 [Kockovaella imperatae]
MSDRVDAAAAYEIASDEGLEDEPQAGDTFHDDRHDDPSQLLSSSSLSSSSRTPLSRNSRPGQNGGSGGFQPTRSQYQIQPAEKFKGVANRIIYSRYYIGFYFIMMSLSLTTVVLSLRATHQRECPPVSWHILEVIVNAMMVLEVSTRWVAFGKKYPMTPLNIIDLLLVLFCSITLILVFRSPCSEGTRQEEVLDTILLVIRNAVQFLRLGNILRRSGHSLLNPPKPIDLSQARTASLALDLDLDLEDEEAVAERHLAGASSNGSRRTLVGSRRGYEPIFQDEEGALEGRSSIDTGGSGTKARSRASGEIRRPLDVGGQRGREGLTEEDEEVWDRMT